jgi:polygalacturonase
MWKKSLLLMAVLFAPEFRLLATEINITTLGAHADGATVSTAIIQKAIDQCSSGGGGTVKIPAGRFVTGTILLKDNVTLHLDANAVLLGSTNIDDYSAPDKFRSGNGAEMGHCLIAAVAVKNVGLAGDGLIDGRGKELLAARPNGNSARPFLARFVHCNGVSVERVHLQQPAAWTMHFSQCSNVTATRVTIDSRGLANNDGMDIDSSEHVRIKNCNIISGDDSVCLKTTSLAPCRDIEITDCDLQSHWAAVKFGTESAADFRNITIARCRIHDTQGGGIKIFSVDGAHIENVTIADVTMKNVNFPLFIRLGARLKTFRAGDARQPIGSIHGITVRNLRAEATSPIGVVISGIPGHNIEAVTLENIDIELPGGGSAEAAQAVLEEKENAYPEITMFGKQFPASGLFARHVKTLNASAVRLAFAKSDLRPAIVLQDADTATLSGWTIPGNKAAESLVRLDSGRNIRIQDFTVAEKIGVFVRSTGGQGIDLGRNSVKADRMLVNADGVGRVQ